MPWFDFFFRRKKAFSIKDELTKLHRFESLLGYAFNDITLLKRALTHKSFVNENRLPSTEQNERYEFLGDAVLELSISHQLMAQFPGDSEGDLSKLRASIVNEVSLATLARNVHLGDYMYLGRGEDQCQGRNKDSLLSDAFEAVLGAIFLDSGFERAHGVIKNRLSSLISRAKRQDINRDYKTKLQEESQIRFRTIPRYQIISETGPDHDKTFEIHLYIKDEIYGHGSGKSKKQAEQNAAYEALEKLEKEGQNKEL